MAYDEDYLSDGDEPPQLVESGDIHSDNNDFVPNGDSSVPITILGECYGVSPPLLVVSLCSVFQYFFGIFFCLPGDLAFQWW